MNNGKEFEELIENIYRRLDSNSIINRNDRLFGFDSNQHREIDVTIRAKVGVHEILIIIQARDYNKPVDINVVGEFFAVIKDVRANKGVLISQKGFTKGALNLAKTLNIETLTAHDSRNSKWKLELKIPIILTTHEGKFNLDFKFSATDEYIEKVAKPNRQIPLPQNFQYRFTCDNGQTIFLPIDKFRQKYLFNDLITDGLKHQIDFTNPNIQLEVEEGLYVPAYDLNITYSISKVSYYKYFDLVEFQGLVNRMTNEINPANFRLVANEFTIDNNGIKEMKSFSFENWIKLKEDEELIQPFKINLYHFPQLKPKQSAIVERVY